MQQKNDIRIYLLARIIYKKSIIYKLWHNYFKLRWVIEQVFRRFENKFKIFSIPAHNSRLDHDYNLLFITCALLNFFYKPIISHANDDNIANKMIARLNVPSKLQKVVEKYNLSQIRAPYIEVNYTQIYNEENFRN